MAGALALAPEVVKEDMRAVAGWVWRTVLQALVDTLHVVLPVMVPVLILWFVFREILRGVGRK